MSYALAVKRIGALVLALAGLSCGGGSRNTLWLDGIGGSESELQLVTEGPPEPF